MGRKPKYAKYYESRVKDKSEPIIKQREVKNIKAPKVDMHKFNKWYYSAKNITTSIIICLFCSAAQAQTIDLSIISTIESSNRPEVINQRTQAYGLYQIRQSALSDYNAWNRTTYTLKDMLSPGRSYVVASWYLNECIPRYLKHYKLDDTIDNRLIAYNFGIGNLVKGKDLPEETRKYIIKYKKLEIK